MAIVHVDWSQFNVLVQHICKRLKKLEVVIVVCLQNLNRGVAQLDSASALGAEGRWFKSSHPDHKKQGKIMKDLINKCYPSSTGRALPL